MKAMILAAGRGERMGALTANCPKPLLEVAGKPLLQHHLERLHVAGFEQVVVNAWYLGDQIARFLERLDTPLQIHLSMEPELLETGGGIHNALPLLGEEPFVVINGDVWTDYPLSRLPCQLNGLAHLVLVENPVHNPSGDFGFQGGVLQNKQPGERTFTFSGVSVLCADLFQQSTPGPFPLGPILRGAADNKQISAEHYQGQWLDVGTPERLQQAEQLIQERNQ